MGLKAWLKAEKGRGLALARELGITNARISQIAREGVPKAHMLAVYRFTEAAVTYEDMLAPPDEPPYKRKPRKPKAASL